MPLGDPAGGAGALEPAVDLVLPVSAQRARRLRRVLDTIRSDQPKHAHMKTRNDIRNVAIVASICAGLTRVACTLAYSMAEIS